MTNVQDLRKMWDVMTQLCLFLRASPKCHGALQTAIKEQGEFVASTRQKLVDLCPTQWVERHDALIAFRELYPAVIAMLEDMSLGSKSPQEYIMSSDICHNLRLHRTV